MVDDSPRNGGGNWTLYGIIAGVVLGMALGYVVSRNLVVRDGTVEGGAGWALAVLNTTEWLGGLFLRALKMAIVPLILFSIMAGVGSLGDVTRLGRTGLHTVAYYLSTTSIAVVLGIVLVSVIRPGIGVDLGDKPAPDEVAPTAFGVVQRIVEDMIPANILAGAVSDPPQVLSLITIALVFGAILTTLGERGARVLDAVSTLSDATLKLVQLIMLFAPIGILGLVAYNLGKAGSEFFDELRRLIWFAFAVVLGLGIHGCLVLPLFLLLLARRNVLAYAKGMTEAFLTAFGTDSSSATLPVTMRCVEHNNGVSNRAASFVLPLGATVNMDGTALYEAVSVIFIAQSVGVELSAVQFVVIFLTATLAAIGAAGIPHAGTVTMILVLQAVGLGDHLYAIGTLLIIDWILDRFRTMVNIWGDAVGAAVVDRTALGAGDDVKH